MRRLLRLLRPQRGKVIVSALCRTVNQGLGVIIPAVAVSLVFSVVDGSSSSGAALSILAGLALVKGAFRYLEQYTGHAVAFRLLAELRGQVFRWLQRLEPARLEDERTGDLVARVSGDIDRVEPFYAHTIAPLVAAVAVPLFTLVGLAWWLDPGVALALAPFLIVYLAFVPWIGSSRVGEIGSEVRRLYGETAAAVTDTVQGSREIAVLGAGPRVVAGLAASLRRRTALERKLAHSAALRSLFGGLIQAAALTVVTLVVVGAGLELVDIAVSLVLAWTVMAPVRALEQIVPDTEQALAAAGRLFEIEDMPAQPRGGDARRPSVGGAVRFDSLTVRAESETLVDSVSLDVPVGSFLGVVGPSGAGKSTLIQTLVRHRDPSAGQVLLGGVPIGDLAPSTLARSVGMVPQRPDVFYGTVASNLRLGAPDAGPGDLMAALERAQLGDWVAGLDDGLETRLGERGVGLSGGEIQRLALARVFLRDPAVLVFDEATSELDAATERAVLDEVVAERGRRTLIVVAHRMETIVAADLLAVMDRGRVVETGTHSELKASNGLYAALWRRHGDVLEAV